MRIVFTPLFITLFLFILSGCSTTGHQVPDNVSGSPSKNKNWKLRQSKLAALSQWGLQARASITYRDENWPFGLDWKQQSAYQYTMRIKHPLTKSELAKIVNTGNSVSLSVNNTGKVYRDNSAEKLIENHLQLKLPVKGMRYWVLGVASPDHPVSSVQLDSRGRPILLKQAGWTIKYAQYNSQKVDALPSSIMVSRSSPQPVQVKMRVRHWN